MLRLAIILVAIAIGITLGITMANRYAKKRRNSKLRLILSILKKHQSPLPLGSFCL